MANNLLGSANDTCKEEGNEPVLVVTAFDQKEDDPIMKYVDANRAEEQGGWLKLDDEDDWQPY